MGGLTLKGAIALANANYDYGGDYILEMMSDKEILERFCGPGGKRRMYEYMRAVTEMRSYIAGVMVG